MPNETADQDLQPGESQPKERAFNLNERVTVRQVGRMFKISDTEYGSTYLIDITDRPDPTTAEPPDQPMVVSATLSGKLDNPQYNGKYANNNGVVCLIINLLDETHRPQAYLSIGMTDRDDPNAKEITSYVLRAAEFKHGSFYVPFSFDSSSAASLVKQEILAATGTNLNFPQLEDADQ